MQRIRKNNCNHLKPTTKQTTWSYFPGQAVQKLQNEAEYPASTLQCLPLIAMITWLLRQREKHRPLQRRTTPFVPWPGHGCSTSSSLDRLFIAVLAFFGDFAIGFDLIPSATDVMGCLRWAIQTYTAVASAWATVPWLATSFNIFQQEKMGKDGKKW